MPLTSAQTATALTALPTTTVASPTPGEGGDPVITITLKFKGSVPFVPVNLFNALITLYGAGKVASSEDGMNPLGPFSFDVGP